MLSPRAHNHRLNAAPVHDVAAIIARFSRPEIESFVDVAIGLLDAVDGDPDREDDDPDGGNIDDEAQGPDCDAEHKLQPESPIDQTDER